MTGITPVSPKPIRRPSLILCDSLPSAATENFYPCPVGPIRWIAASRFFDFPNTWRELAGILGLRQSVILSEMDRKMSYFTRRVGKDRLAEGISLIVTIKE